MGIFYLENIFAGREEKGFDFLLDIVYSIASNGESLFLEYGYPTWLKEFNVENVDTFVDKHQRVWYRPSDKEQAKAILDYDFLINGIILTNETDIDSMIYKLKVVEDIDSIRLMVTEYNEGDFLKLLQTSLKPFLDQGVCIAD
ncbi:hypothetical protein [Paenibacillus planticolens]|uniref:Uncharacterized protein n=1 Tax=Paenibacillus planticolens TaxID=2654976 RepID=A0ABX1ZU49_9BACL|nr:hypothetical protein [Paenibacillus planticolens]NOV02343.1 hypothetical protein [Paenibacillus planticolens]